MSEQANLASAHMEDCMKHATPGEGHKALEPFVGSWNARVTMWMDPSQPPIEADGVMENRWIHGGRFLEQRYTGEFMGEKFEGRGYIGFNNGSRKYEGFWIDTASTCMSTDVGDYDAASRTWTMHGKFQNPGDGSEATKRTIIKITSPDEHSMETWFPTPDGGEFKCMEIVYRRKK